MLLSIVGPVLNESGTITLMLVRLRETLRGRTRDVIFADDGSTDAISEILERAALEDLRVKVLSSWRIPGPWPDFGERI